MDAARYRARLMRDRMPFSYSTMIVRVEGRREVERAVVARVDRDWRVIPGTERSHRGRHGPPRLRPRVQIRDVAARSTASRSSTATAAAGCRCGMPACAPPCLASMRRATAAASAARAAHCSRAASPASRRRRELGRHQRERGHSARLPSRSRRLARINRFVADAQPASIASAQAFTSSRRRDTLVCRCEERTRPNSTLLVAGGATDPNSSAPLSRIGMGRCQGRNCASHVAATIARKTGRDISAVAPPTARPPVKPVPVGAIAAERHQHDAEVQLS